MGCSKEQLVDSSWCAGEALAPRHLGFMPAVGPQSLSNRAIHYTRCRPRPRSSIKRNKRIKRPSLAATSGAAPKNIRKTPTHKWPKAQGIETSNRVAEEAATRRVTKAAAHRRATCANQNRCVGEAAAPRRLGYIYIYIYIYLSLYIYIYIYIYGWCPIPPCFLTTLQYTKLHGIESLGIIFQLSKKA